MEFGRKLIDCEPGCKQNRACFVKRLDPGLNVFVYTLYFVIYYRAIQRCKRTTAAKISELINLSLRIYSEVARWIIGANKFAEPNKASSCRRDCKCCVCYYIFYSLRDLEKKKQTHKHIHFIELVMTS